MSSTGSAFFFDLASPLAYLVAERILHVLPAAAEWRPVLARELRPTRVGSGCGSAADEEVLRERVERRAHALGLQPVRWPEPFPFDSSLAMRAAAYAASIGRAVPFAQAAFRQAFAGGHSLEDPDFVLVAAAACEMHPAAVMQGAELRASGERLARAASEARRAGIGEVPAVLLAGEVFVGEEAPERAAAHAGAAGKGGGGGGGGARR